MCKLKLNDLFEMGLVLFGGDLSHGASPMLVKGLTAAVPPHVWALITNTNPMMKLMFGIAPSS